MNQLEHAQFNMVEQQLRPNQVLDARVLAAINWTSRADYCDPAVTKLAFADTQLPIGYGQTMLSPLLEGRFLQILQISEQDVVLEIGTGSGYFTALLAKLAKQVISVEIIAELSELAGTRLQQSGFDNIALQVGDGSSSWPLTERVDVIVMTGAVTAISDDYLHLLQVGGRLLAVTGDAPAMTVQVVTRTAEREWHTDSLFETVIPYLFNAQPEAEFEF